MMQGLLNSGQMVPNTYNAYTTSQGSNLFNRLPQQAQSVRQAPILNGLAPGILEQAQFLNRNAGTDPMAQRRIEELNRISAGYFPAQEPDRQLADAFNLVRTLGFRDEGMLAPRNPQEFPAYKSDLFSGSQRQIEDMIYGGSTLDDLTKTFTATAGQGAPQSAAPVNRLQQALPSQQQVAPAPDSPLFQLGNTAIADMLFNALLQRGTTQGARM